MADFNTVRPFDILIPATVMAGTPVDCTTASAPPKTLYLPIGNGQVRLYVAAKTGGNYVYIDAYTLGASTQKISLGDLSFGFARLDRYSGSGAATAQIAGQPIPGGAQLT